MSIDKGWVVAQMSWSVFQALISTSTTFFTFQYFLHSQMFLSTFMLFCTFLTPQHSSALFVLFSTFQPTCTFSTFKYLCTFQFFQFLSPYFFHFMLSCALFLQFQLFYHFDTFLVKLWSHLEPKNCVPISIEIKQSSFEQFFKDHPK